MSCDESNEREMNSSLSKLSQSKSLSRVANSEESETSADEQDVETGSMMFIRKKQLRNDHKKSKHGKRFLVSFYPNGVDFYSLLGANSQNWFHFYFCFIFVLSNI